MNINNFKDPICYNTIGTFKHHIDNKLWRVLADNLQESYNIFDFLYSTIIVMLEDNLASELRMKVYNEYKKL